MPGLPAYFARQPKAQLTPSADPSRLTDEAEIDLSRKLAQFPDVLENCAHQLDPAALPRYLQELASTFHYFYGRCRVIDNDRDLSADRLALVDAVRIVLHNGLVLLGITAPEKM